MADQNQSDRDSQIGDQRGDQKQDDQSKKAGSSNRGQEQDDVAEDRNLSGSSTWLTLPDEQPAGDDQSSGGSSGSNR
ncbi:MAG TPA: hypothetical protein VN706_10670 [Gemmatimonadaceae bacterium]|nr:hypothetical protein [Gemmatimonadaceae bacterium]